ncbi:tetratricopeptide repeat protein [Shewanella sp. ULN5]|uniref:tetratricopeptide repeat protein n=1 Tax=Shewanella sp. ULN5 TaxID=2994678 RepID=UPI00273ED0E4|nr:tetratricopeptide repeat protein [Shewanella sp. ULN5]MDP5147708.1 tetratricopeptide repeat protein [Shewanella sp. ULN5]
MSVINKMLQDLEQRQQNEDGTSKAETNQFIRPTLEFTSQVAKPKKSRLVWLAFLVLLAMTWIGFSLFNQANRVVNNTSPSSQPLLDDKVVAAKTPKESNAPAYVTPQTVSAENSMLASQDADLSMSHNAEVADEQQIQVTLNGDTASSAISQLNDNQVVAPKTDSKVTVTSENAHNTQLNTSESEVQSVAKNAVEPVKNTPVSAEDTKEVKPVVHSRSEDGKVNSSMTVTEVKLTKKQLAQVQFKKAQTAENDKRLDDAASLYLDTIILDPSLHSARKQLANIYYGRNNADTALQLLESGIGMFPTHWEFYLMKANIENALQEYNSALISLSYIDDNSEFARDKWVYQGDIAQKAAQFSVSEAAYRSLLKIESTQARWWMGLAYALDSQQEYIKAAAAYRSALNYPGLSNSATEFVKQRLVQLGENQ